MAIYFGNNKIKPTMFGLNNIGKMYYGNNLIYEAVTPVVENYFYVQNNDTSAKNVAMGQNGTAPWSGYYKIDDGEWAAYTIATEVSLAVGSKMYFKGELSSDQSTSSYLKFTTPSTGTLSVGGNIMSLWCGDNYKTATAPPYNYAGWHLFDGWTALTDASQLKLPATTLTNDCYAYMFNNCFYLTTAPTIDAVVGGYESMEGMFKGCRALTQIPRLHTSSFTGNYCYWNAFNGCTNLKLSAAQTGEYVNEFRIPAIGTGTNTYSSTFYSMFGSTGGTFVGAPTINTTYYTSNTVVPILTPEVTRIELVTPPAKTYYAIGEQLTMLGLSITAYWNTGLVETINYGDSGLSYSPAEGTVLTTLGTQNVTISYGGKSITQSIEVVTAYVTNVSILTPPTKTTYNLGEVINMAGLALTVTWSDSTTTTVNYGDVGITYDPAEGTATRSSTTGVTISYGGKSVVQSIEVVGIAHLCFTANTANSTVILSKNGSPAWAGSYSTDGSTWNEYVPGTTGAITLTNVGDKVYFKGTQTAAFDFSNYLKFVMTGSIAGSGNCMSLWCGDDFETATAIPYGYAGYRLFYGCSALTTPPALPATTLTSGCYAYMFDGCTSLTTAPALPATTLQVMCYNHMFEGCTSLTTPPTLPATTLTMFCYEGMFQGCRQLTTAPALPATTLADYCYQQMFVNCTSLIVSDTSGTGYDVAWTIPTTGTFTSTVAQTTMFTNCAGTRASDDMAGEQGQSYTYYTQNTPRA